jgi:hypothetical protein
MKGCTLSLLLQSLQEFDHELSLLIALTSASISFRLVNVVFRDSGRACLLAVFHIVHDNRSLASLPLSAASVCFLAIPFRTEIPSSPFYLRKKTSIAVLCPIPTNSQFQHHKQALRAKACHDFPLPLPLPRPAPTSVPILVLLSLLGFTAPMLLFSSRRSDFSSAFALSSALTSMKW